MAGGPSTPNWRRPARGRWPRLVAAGYLSADVFAQRLDRATRKLTTRPDRRESLGTSTQCGAARRYRFGYRAALSERCSVTGDSCELNNLSTTGLRPPRGRVSICGPRWCPSPFEAPSAAETSAESRLWHHDGGHCDHAGEAREAVGRGVDAQQQGPVACGHRGTYDLPTGRPPNPR